MSQCLRHFGKTRPCKLFLVGPCKLLLWWGPVNFFLVLFGGTCKLFCPFYCMVGPCKLLKRPQTRSQFGRRRFSFETSEIPHDPSRLCSSDIFEPSAHSRAIGLIILHAKSLVASSVPGCLPKEQLLFHFFVQWHRSEDPKQTVFWKLNVWQALNYLE